MFFMDFVEECQEGMNIIGKRPILKCILGIEESVKLDTLLSFFTGADVLPPLGYKTVTLDFNNSNIYPTASTCSIQLTLPTKHSTYDEFKHHMIVGLTMHGGFGLV